MNNSTPLSDGRIFNTSQQHMVLNREFDRAFNALVVLQGCTRKAGFAVSTGTQHWVLDTTMRC